MIDTHLHINSQVLKNLKQEILAINNNPNITRVINIGMNKETNQEVLDIALTNEKFYCSLGIHPLYEGEIKTISEFTAHEAFFKVVALGETGIDFKGDISVQKRRFIETIELANFLKLPVIIHANRTNKECLDIIKAHTPQYGFVFHCFEPDLEILKEIMLMNGFISLGTPITKKTAKKSLEVLKEVDINNLLIETDYPFMKFDENSTLEQVFARVKSLRNYEEAELNYILENNTKRLFKKLT